jgi:hypothetical protein
MNSLASGMLLLLLAALLLAAVARWEIGPEFLPWSLACAVLGVAFLRAARRAR